MPQVYLLVHNLVIMLIKYLQRNFENLLTF
nr:MAG TPA: hypothetical protein [Caudoviricetes sp.]